MTPFNSDDQRHMARALQLAAQGLYSTHPNPRVGCVLVKDGRIVGEGFHRRAGEGHAEVNALAAAGSDARGASAYVTLEPCSHQGRTPPCADALVAAGVSRVISAMQDPNPLVAGRGHQRLQEAGISVAWGLLETQARALNSGFISRMSRGRPWVRIKQAMSLDGRTAMASGESVWITGADARSDVQRLRASSSAILTGIGTVLADDPALTLRAEQLRLPDAEQVTRRQPLRVVLDSQLRTPCSASLLQQPGESLIFHCSHDPERAAALEKAGASLVRLPALEPDVILRWLAKERECNDVLVEAGATLTGSLIQADLADELIVYMATTLLGDAARPLFHLPGIDRMAQQRRLNLTDLRQVGADLRLTLTPSVTQPPSTTDTNPVAGILPTTSTPAEEH